MATTLSPFKYAAKPWEIRGNLIKAPLKHVFIGEICQLKNALHDTQIITTAQVIAFNDGNALLTVMGSIEGLSLNTWIVPTGNKFTLPISDNLLGNMIDVQGNILYPFSDQSATQSKTKIHKPINVQAPDILTRAPIHDTFRSGIRAIDSLLTTGIGQRVGIFASAGCGKTMLMNMIIDHSDADVYIIALIGERGREVTEFLQSLEKSPRAAQVILVSSTSDQPAINRVNTALVATTLAEYFRDQGKHVVLFVDSLTRYCRALRDIALVSGELPARRGYPASVFEQLPALLERPGKLISGAITAFYTVLVESEEEPDAIGDEVRSIIDGHIYLSGELASQGHYPAIDILKSKSRLFQEITPNEHQVKARQFRENLLRQQKLKLLVDIGEYQSGENSDNDNALALEKTMLQFLQQDWRELIVPEQSLKELYEIFK